MLSRVRHIIPLTTVFQQVILMKPNDFPWSNPELQPSLEMGLDREQVNWYIPEYTNLQTTL